MTYRKLTAMIKQKTAGGYLSTTPTEEVKKFELIREVVEALCTLQAEEMISRTDPQKGVTGFLDSEVSRIAAKMLKEKSRGFYVEPSDDSGLASSPHNS